MAADGFLPVEPIDSEDRQKEDERAHRDDHVRKAREFELEQANVQRELLEKQRWEDAYGPEDLLRPAERPEPEGETTIRLEIPS